MPKWEKGQSGNPDGRPKGLSITALVKEELEKVPEGEKRTRVAEFVDKMLKKAVKDGDTVTQKMIWNYIDGLPRETKDVNLNLPKPLTDITKLKEDEISNHQCDQEDSETRKED